MSYGRGHVRFAYARLSGSHRAPARAMLKAVGFTDDDLQ